MKLLVPPLPLGLCSVWWKGREAGSGDGMSRRGRRVNTVVLLACRSRLTVAEGQQMVGRLRCCRCRAHDGPVLLGQKVDPGAEVVGMPHGRDHTERR
jgi:hypothetical protein